MSRDQQLNVKAIAELPSNLKERILANMVLTSLDTYLSLIFPYPVRRSARLQQQQRKKNPNSVAVKTLLSLLWSKHGVGQPLMRRSRNGFADITVPLKYGVLKIDVPGDDYDTNNGVFRVHGVLNGNIEVGYEVNGRHGIWFTMSANSPHPTKAMVRAVYIGIGFAIYKYTMDIVKITREVQGNNFGAPELVKPSVKEIREYIPHPLMRVLFLDRNDLRRVVLSERLESYLQ